MILTELYCVSFCSRRQPTAGEFRNQVSIPCGMESQGSPDGRCIDGPALTLSQNDNRKRPVFVMHLKSTDNECADRRVLSIATYARLHAGSFFKSTVCWIDSR